VQHVIKVKNVTKTFGTTVAVDNVSFTVEKREVLGFLGPNGAGKTTTMRMMTCYIPPDRGTIEIDGFDIFDNSLEVRRLVGYLPENNPLYLDMGVVDYLLFVAEIRGVPAPKRMQRVRDMVEMCSLEREIKKDIGELSRGYRQRVGLAQTLIHNPEILICDEPTSGLDPNQIIEIRELIKRIGKEKTVVLSTHILPEVTATCDRTIIISNGRLVADGTPDELVRRGSGGVTVIVTIKAPKSEIEAKLQKLSHVGTIRCLGAEPDDFLRYEIKVGNGADPSEDIFRLAVENRWVLRELRQERATLEEVFKQLTT
jgi:ABC-2 type transport system ATP-binding protein